MALRVSFGNKLAAPEPPRITQTVGPMCHPHGIRGFGNTQAGVIVVGIAPGHDEYETTKRPFTGKSGQLLDDLLNFSGWSREKVYATNCICWLDNAPVPADIEKCSRRLYYELTEYNPRVIVTMGVIANETITGAKRRKGSRGSVTWSDRWKCYILDTHHPSFALQAQSLSVVQDIIRDLSKIPEVLTWQRDGSHADVAYYAVQTIDEAQRALNMLPRTSPVTLDIETSNTDVADIDAYTDQLLCFAVSFMRDGKEYNYVFPQTIFPDCVRNGTHVRAFKQHGKCGACDLSEHVFDWPTDVQWSFQAGQGDIHGLFLYFGVQLPLYDDTMLMSYCIDERPGYHGLKDNAREFLGSGWYEAEVKPFYKGKMNLLPPEAVNEYNAKDAAYTRRLAPIFRRRMEEDNTVSLYTDLLLPSIRVFLDQQIRGINIDQARLKQLAYEGWFPRYLEMQKEIAAEAHALGWPTEDFNTKSALQMRDLFSKVLGVEPTKWSPKTGLPSYDKETLDSIKHPFAARVRELRTLDTITDYVLAVTNHLKYDGLLHPMASVTTTRTGRTSYRDPAMQTIPKPYTVGADYARLREVIIPHNPDTHEIIEADYNQIEVWLAWAESRDPTLLEHLQSGDVHSRTAEGAFNVQRGDFTPGKWSEYRQNAKRIRFGLQYGEGAEKLSSPPPIGLGCSIVEARKYVMGFWKTYPNHRRWTLDIQKQVVDEGYLRTPSGRVMRFPMVLDHKSLRQAINFPIQANASDYCLKAMIKLAPLLLAMDAHILLMIHDALVVESPKHRRAEVIELIRQVMTEPQFDGYPSVGVEVAVGPNLGQMEKV